MNQHDTDEMPELDFSHAKRAKDVPALARIQKELEGKERITIRLDADVLAWFRNQVKGGGNYQTLINDTLRAAISPENAPVTVGMLRKVLRQELHAS
ncbi:MAG: BrnA antitoxin family protein [Rhodanobacteraceae bacterium]